MADEKIFIKMYPTPAARNMSEKDLLTLSRIIKLPPEKVKERISMGKGIKISITEHPSVNKLLKLVRSYGFNVSASQPGERKAVTGEVRRLPDASSKKPAPPRKEITEWKVGDLIENLYEVRDIRYGGMGAVYVVRHLRWNTMMAVKSLYDRLRGSEEELALFVKEAETWIDIGFHPNIAACYYVRNIRGSPRIFIEYADGGALNEWLVERGRVGWDIMIDLMVQVGDGLDHAHSKGLVHRDVKPGNCMLTKEGIVKVTDFGLTKRREREAGTDSTQALSTSSGLIPVAASVTATGMGTPAYMAPEMWVAGGEVGPQADIYAFGVMAFEICCGRKPFLLAKGDKLGRLALEHVKMPPPSPRSFRPDIPPQVEEIILRCLKKSVTERYASFKELRADLAAAYEEIFRSSFPRERPDELKLRSDALNNRAVSLMDLNHHNEARAALEQALESDPHHPEAVYNLGVLEWLSTGEPDRELVVRMEEVVKTPEYRGRGGHLLGRCLLALGDAEGALKACELSLSQPDADEAWLKPYAIALLGTGREEDALAHLETYMQEFSNDDEALGWVIGAQMRKGRRDEALAHLQSIPKGSQIAAMGPEAIADSFIFSKNSEALVLQKHTGWITCVANFPKSRRLISAARDRTLKVWNAVTGEEILTVNVLGEPPTLLRISPDEKYAAFATAKTGDAVSILDLESGRIVGHLLAQERVSGLGFSADGKHIVTVEEKGWARLWEADYFKAASVFKIPAHTAADVVFVNESQPQVFVSAMDRILRRISLTDSQTLNFEKGHQDQVIALKAAPDGSRVVSGGKDKLAILWDGSTGQSLTICRAHRDPVSEVALNPVRNLVASYDPKAGIKVWQAQSGMVIRTFSTGESLANCLLFTPEGGEVVAGGRDMALRVWDVRGRSTMPELALARILPVRKQMISDREFKVMLDTAGKAIRKRAYATAYSLIRKALTMPGHERSDAALEMILRMKENGKRIGLHGAWNKKSISAAAGVMDVCISPSAINFFSAQSDHTIRMWSTKTGDCLKTFKGHTNLVACLALSFNGREAVSGGDDRAVRTWDITTGRSLLVLQGHTDSVSSVTYSENGKTVLSGSWDGTIRQWHLPEGTLVKTLRAHEDKINTVALISHQEIVFSGGFEGVVRMWDLSTGKLLREMKGHRDRITSLSVSSSGELVISGSMDGTVRIWDVKRGTTIGTLEADATGVRVVAFSPEQKFALTGGNDAVLRIWNLETSQCLREFQGHSREISGARFSSNGRFIVTSSVDGGVIIWEVDWEWVFPGQKTTGTIIAPKKE